MRGVVSAAVGDVAPSVDAAADVDCVDCSDCGDAVVDAVAAGCSADAVVFGCAGIAAVVGCAAAAVEASPPELGAW